MRINIDDSELRNLGLDMSNAPLRIQLGASKVVRRGAEIVDAGMRRAAGGVPIGTCHHNCRTRHPACAQACVAKSSSGRAGV